MSAATPIQPAQPDRDAPERPLSNATRWARPRRRVPHYTRRTLVIFSQVFVPDPASVGQHIADVAVEMVKRGWHVRVLTADRGYDDPSVRYPRRESYRGVDVWRLPFSSFGKKSIFTRVLGTASFMLQAIFRGALTPNLAGVFFSTSPPLIGFAATLVKVFRTVPIIYWAMDLNPDQLVAMGKLKRRDWATTFLESTNRMILKNSSLIIALDRFMAGRLNARVKLAHKMAVIPPWPHETFVETVPREQNPFREQHELQGKFVVMYSGNHSPSNPLNTLLEAARQLKHDDSIRFAFIGGGIGKKAVEEFCRTNELTNCLCLPYQPLDQLRFSLSAADVHVVALGDNMVGIIHPCKVYGAMAVARPVLFFGPQPSHISDLLARHGFGEHVSHGDVDGAVRAIEALKAKSQHERDEMGVAGQRVLRETLSQELLCGRLCDGLELALGA